MVKLKVKVYSSIKERALGLIGHKKATPAMFFTRFGIHTLGLKFPIDVVVLDKNNRVVKLVENLRPNNFFIWPFKYNRVLELPSGYIKRFKIRKEEEIKLEKLVDTSVLVSQ
ncbi:MAG TPA: DUF192 domain-containing protein [Patescibacteria group bacterium]|nr:DUF192 domain-containing protein [Patescibacteria group bacterium]